MVSNVIVPLYNIRNASDDDSYRITFARGAQIKTLSIIFKL